MNVLLNDSSVLLNLLAADCLAAVSGATGWRFAVCPAVHDEVKKLRDAATGELVTVDLTPLIASGLLQVLELDGDGEQTLYVEQSSVVDDGEAMSIAIAASRKLALAMDDRQASGHTRRSFPELRLWTTPEILKHWSDTSPVAPEELQAAIRLIEVRARYFPPKSHPLSGWWTANRGGDPV